jgi:hypothetical protein
MSNEAKIRLLRSKSHAYRLGLSQAIASGDQEAADKWEQGYLAIQGEIEELRKRVR